jgi:hypothetical protein
MAVQDTIETDRTVEAELTFIVPQDEKPVFYSAAYTGTVPKVLFETEQRSVTVRDLRHGDIEPTLEREGFELQRIETAVEDLDDDEAVTTAYYAEIEAILKKRFSADRVVIFDATRRSDGGDGAANPDGKRGPATRVHVDYTLKSGPQRLKDAIGDAAGERLLASGARVVQVNIWRPIRGPVLRSPLAVADATTVAREELIATDQVFPDRVGEIYQLAYGDAQRWYYASEMTRDEVLLLKGWDTADKTGSGFAPHGAFDLPGTPPDAPPRESIEVRTFVVIE